MIGRTSVTPALIFAGIAWLASAGVAVTAMGRERPRFALEAGQPFSVLRKRLWKDLDRDLPS